MNIIKQTYLDWEKLRWQEFLNNIVHLQWLKESRLWDPFCIKSRSVVINFLNDKIVSNKFKECVVVCYKEQADADYVLVFSAVEDQNKLNENCAHLNYANYQIQHRWVFEENIEPLVTTVCWYRACTFADWFVDFARKLNVASIWKDLRLIPVLWWSVRCTRPEFRPISQMNCRSMQNVAIPVKIKMMNSINKDLLTYLIGKI